MSSNPEVMFVFTANTNKVCAPEHRHSTHKIYGRHQSKEDPLGLPEALRACMRVEQGWCYLCLQKKTRQWYTLQRGRILIHIHHDQVSPVVQKILQEGHGKSLSSSSSSPPSFSPSPHTHYFIRGAGEQTLGATGSCASVQHWAETHPQALGTLVTM